MHCLQAQDTVCDAEASESVVERTIRISRSIEGRGVINMYKRRESLAKVVMS